MTVADPSQLAIVGADPRQKLIALVRYVNTPECPIELPGFMKIPLAMASMWTGSIETMSLEDLDRAAQHMQDLAAKVRDPDLSVADFEAWLPRRAPGG
jgi:hypothetical protein